MSLGAEQEQFSRHFCMLLQEAFRLGFEARIGEVERTVDQQQIYMKTGRSKTMNSRHLVKCAGDVFFFKDGVWIKGAELQPLGDYWESLDPKNSWGGNWKSFKDEPHFERRP